MTSDYFWLYLDGGTSNLTYSKVPNRRPVCLFRTFAESICTHYSDLSGRPDIYLGSGTFKKSGTLLFAKSRVQKSRVIVIQKRRDQAASSFFE